MMGFSRFLLLVSFLFVSLFCFFILLCAVSGVGFCKFLSSPLKY